MIKRRRKLTPELVDMIRDLLADGIPRKVIMRSFSIDGSQLSKIANNKRWVCIKPKEQD